MSSFTHAHVIGLEVHIQLSTQSKAFANSATDSGKTPNTLTDPITLGLPGALPVLNRAVVNDAIKLGLATNSKISEKTFFTRKHYNYPDLPKGYQISQSDLPICRDGYLQTYIGNKSKRIKIARIRIEEDAGKTLHPTNQPHSLIDLNRAGIPLLEIISEPEILSPKEAGAYLRELYQLVTYLNICNGNMEEGNFRCDANVSIKQKGSAKLGTKVEIKNINSFKYVEKAIAFEIERQEKIISSSEKIAREVRMWDEKNNETKLIRTKENTVDYRYFPDPDLLPLIIDDAWIENIKTNLPELPAQIMQRFIESYKLKTAIANIILNDKFLVDYFEKALLTHFNPVGIANWITTELFERLNTENNSFENCPISAQHIAMLVQLIDNKIISGKIAKDVFNKMFATGKDPETIVDEENLTQISNSKVIEKTIDTVLAKNPAQLEQYKAGKTQLFGFFVGQIMKESNGKTNPKLTNEILKKKLGE